MTNVPLPEPAPVQQPGQPSGAPSRRMMLSGGALGAAALVSWRALGLSRPAPDGRVADVADGPAQPAARTYDFNRGWLFGGEYAPGSEQTGYADSGFAPVTVPHTVVPLSWGNWDHTTWEKVFIYRKHFSGVGLRDGDGGRVFADFDGVLCQAAVYVNG
ncbi:MAG TPA: hypothetical protein VH089_07625, partial [Streptosporangiaceae bacterium]|nr:hypothetical protein [Streptosporangiaceae bacterium]